jgi:hypothetical protein
MGSNPIGGTVLNVLALPAVIALWSPPASVKTCGKVSSGGVVFRHKLKATNDRGSFDALVTKTLRIPATIFDRHTMPLAIVVARRQMELDSAQGTPVSQLETGKPSGRQDRGQKLTALSKQGRKGRRPVFSKLFAMRQSRR